MKKFIIKYGIFTFLLFSIVNGYTQTDKVLHFTITQPNQITITDVLGHPTAFGLTDGFINITPNDNGNTPYSYEWVKNPFSTIISNSQNLTNVGAGSYTLTIKDTNYANVSSPNNAGCTFSQTFILTEPPELTVSIAQQQNILCFGDNSGSLIANPIGGTGTYNYHWYRSTGGVLIDIFQTTQIATNLAPGAYIVSVTDRGGNGIIKWSSNFTISQPSQLAFTSSSQNISCNGLNDGTITINPQGGTAPYFYKMLGEATFNSSNTRSGLSNGTHFFTVRDTNGCEVDNLSSGGITITEPTSIVITIAVTGFPTSNGATDASIDATISGGTPSNITATPYTYQWKDNLGNIIGTSEDILGIGAGTYTLTVIDNNGCIEISQPIIITEPQVLSVTISELSITCFGLNDGELTANVTGGVPNPDFSYNYQWLILQGSNFVDIFQNTQTASLLGVGTYKVNVTDANGNTTSLEYILQEPTLLEINNSNIQNNLCNGDLNGAINITVIGGTGTYNYDWRDSLNMQIATTQNVSNLSADFYTVFVADANGCEVSQIFEITEPTSAINITLDNLMDPSAFGNLDGSINITVNGGMSPYTFSWIDNSNNQVISTNEDITNLGDGTYTITATDSNGCTTQNSFTLTEPGLLQVVIQIENPLSCFNDTNGLLRAIATGGVGTYSYEWFEVNGPNLISINQTTEIATNLSSKIYKVKVIDQNATEVFSNDFTFIQPNELVATVNSINDILCFNATTGAVDINIYGGTTPYTFQWNDSNLSTTEDLVNAVSGIYEVIITDFNNCQTVLSNISISQPNAAISVINEVITPLSGFQTNDGQINLTVQGGTTPYSYQWTGPNVFTSTQNPPLQNLEEGTYNLIITDANGCVSQTYQYIVSQPSALIFTFQQNLFNLCFGDSNAELEAIVAGGVPPYSYNWSYLEDNTITFNDSNIISNLQAGTYSLTVTDANNIQISNQITVTQNDQIQLLNSTLNNVSCYGESTGSVDIEVIGGTGTYSYFWSNGEITQDITNLPVGLYNVTILDSNNCSISESFEITEPTQLFIIDPILTQPLGAGLANGSISVSATGGTPTYTYQWFDVNNVIIAGETSQTIANIPADTYSILITDNLGCTVQETFILEEPSPLNVDLSYQEILCFDGLTIIEANTIGGVGGYQYQWFDSADSLIGTDTSLFDVIAGNYYVIVTDSNGISATQNINVIQPAQIVISLVSITDTICVGTNTGNIDIEVTGGTGNYSYNWSNGNITQDLNNVHAGTYIMSVTDENGCLVMSQPFTISESTITVDYVILTQPSVFGATDGAINLTMVVDINGDFTFQWYQEDVNGNNVIINGATSSLLDNIGEGTYTVIITNFLGCTLEVSYLLGQPDPLTVAINQIEFINCFGDISGGLTAIADGGVGGYQYEWYNADTNQIIIGQTNPQIYNLPAGNYYVIVNDPANAVIQSATFNISQPTQIVVTNSYTNISCFGNNDGIINLAANGGNGGYFYRIKQGSQTYTDWINFDNANNTTIQNLIAETYLIQIMNTSGCNYEINGQIETLIFNIAQPELLEISSTTLNNPTGFGLSNGSINIVVNGGSAPYQYEWLDSSNNVLSTTNELNDISAGIYTVNITDDNGCSITSNYILEQPNALITNITIQSEIFCNGDSGSLVVTTQGGVPFTNGSPYTYQWFQIGSGTVISTNALLTNATAGEYYAIVEDANGNIITSNIFNFIEPDLLATQFSASYTECGTENDWEIHVEVTGGTPPYNYAWNTGNSSDTITNQTPGNYLVIISDAHGCQYNENYTIEVPEILAINTEITELNCFDICDGEIALEITGGVEPYTITWEDGSHNLTRTELCEGIYELIVTDQKGCILEYTYELEYPEEITIELEENITLCNGQDVDFDISINDENAIYNWESSNGFNSSSPTVTLSNEGIYFATITTELGCVITDSIEIIKSNVGINAEFLLTTQAFAEEDVILINTSNPIGNGVEWIIPDDVQIVEQNNETITLRFNFEGIYDISLRSFQGNCTADYTKTIIVEEARELPDVGNADNPFITEFTTFPNPASGEFTTSITLAEPASISLRLYNLISNVPIDDRQVSGNNEYNLNYNMNLPFGVYFLLLETPNASEIRKIIIE